MKICITLVLIVERWGWYGKLFLNTVVIQCWLHRQHHAHTMSQILNRDLATDLSASLWFSVHRSRNVVILSWHKRNFLLPIRNGIMPQNCGASHKNAGSPTYRDNGVSHERAAKHARRTPSVLPYRSSSRHQKQDKGNYLRLSVTVVAFRSAKLPWAPPAHISASSTACIGVPGAGSMNSSTSINDIHLFKNQ